MSAFRMKTKFFFISLLLCACLASLTACDFTPPEIETFEITADYNTSVSVEELASVTDNKEVASVVISEISPTGAEISEDSLSALFPAPGDYTITLTAADASGNEATAQAAVCVLDNIAPVFTYVPESAVVECGTPISASSQSDASDAVYAVAEDEISSVTLSFSDVEPASDEALDSFTFDSSTVTFTALGDYVITIAAADSSGNLTTAALPVTVVDTTPPTFSEVETVRISESARSFDFLDGVSAVDAVDGDLTNAISVSSTDVKYGVPGEYQATISVSDLSGNQAQQTIAVVISDDTPPVISLSKSSLSYTVGDDKPDYSSLATAKDAVDGDVSGTIAVDDSSVDYKTPGTYTVTYTVSDDNGNKSVKSMPLTVNAKKQTTSGTTGSQTQTSSSGTVNLQAESDSEVTVYITDSGTKYHRAGCRFLSKSKIEISLSKAKARGYTACKVCFG